jgi:hypothetical protein
MYDPTASSLTRQNWAYQQKLIDEMGEGLGSVQSSVTPVRTPGVWDYVSTCGLGLVSAGFAGYAAGRIGVVQAGVGVGIAYVLLKAMQR